LGTAPFCWFYDHRFQDNIFHRLEIKSKLIHNTLDIIQYTRQHSCANESLSAERMTWAQVIETSGWEMATPQAGTISSNTGAPAEDDWASVSDPSERRKIQNRIAQRKFRKSPAQV
jgi:hypothetical protein